jgi:hypothetical protein
MADNKTTIEVSIEAAEAAKTVQELKKSLKDLVNQQANVAAGSAEWKKLTQAINDTEGKIGDLTDSFKTLQGSGVERVTSSFNLLKEGFTSFDSGKIKAAFNGIGAAMKAVPIFLIVEGITYLVSNFKELSQGSGIVAKALQFVGGIIDGLVDAVYMLTDALGLTNSALEKQGEVAEENAKKVTEALAEQTAEYDRQIAVAKANGENTVELEIKKQQAILATNKTIAEQSLALIKAGKELTEDEVKRAKEAVNNIKNATAQIEIIRATESKRIDDENKKRTEQQAELNKKLKEEEQKRYEEWLANLDKYTQAERERRIKERAEALGLDTEALQRNLDREAALRKSKLIEAEINSIANQNDIDAQIAFLNQKRINELNAEGLTFQDKELINAKYAKQFEDLEKKKTDIANAEEKQRQQAALDVASKTIAATQALTDAYFAFKLAKAKGDDKATLELAKKQFNINKGLQIANATIQGVQAVLAAYSSGAAVPVVGTVLGPVYAALAGITAAAQIAKIASTKFDGGGASGGGGGSISAPSPSIPSAPTVSTPTNNISGTQFDAQGNTITPQAQQPTITVRAQVVESDMTDTQNTVTKYKAQSTF